MIHTTRGLFVKLDNQKRKLQRVTTKTIDASIKIMKPKKDRPKPTVISTRDIGDLNDLAEKKKRDKISKERKAEARKARKEAKKEKKKVPGYKPPPEDSRRPNKPTPAPPEKKVKLVEPSEGLKIELKKAWKDMSDAEKKIVMKERMAKARESKKKKKAVSEDTGNYAKLRR